jgi:hypothetical protein
VENLMHDANLPPPTRPTDDLFPSWLKILREAGYRLDRVPPLQRRFVIDWLKRKQILLGPGDAHR